MVVVVGAVPDSVARPSSGSAEGGRRTTGLLGSDAATGGRERGGPVGEMRTSADISRAKDDLRLMATLGE